MTRGVLALPSPAHAHPAPQHRGGGATSPAAPQVWSLDVYADRY